MKRTNLKKLRKGRVEDADVVRRKGFSPTRRMPDRGIEWPVYPKPTRGHTNYVETVQSPAKTDQPKVNELFLALAMLSAFRRHS